MINHVFKWIDLYPTNISQTPECQANTGEFTMGTITIDQCNQENMQELLNLAKVQTTCTTPKKGRIKNTLVKYRNLTHIRAHLTLDSH